MTIPWMLNLFHKSFISWNYYIRSLQWMKNLLLKLIWIKLNDSPRLVVVNFNRLFSTSTRNRDDFFERNVSLKRILFLQAGSPLSRTTVVPEVPGCIEEWVPWFELASLHFSLPNLWEPTLWRTPKWVSLNFFNEWIVRKKRIHYL